MWRGELQVRRRKEGDLRDVEEVDRQEEVVDVGDVVEVVVPSGVEVVVHVVVVADLGVLIFGAQIGRASCRERV